LGTAIICLNLHHPLDVAEQVAVADILSDARLAPGYGSGSTPEEYAYFGSSEPGEDERHERFEEALQIMCEAWSGRVRDITRRFFKIPAHDPLPIAAPDLRQRSWVSVNSLGAARIAGRLGFNVLYSHLRTPEQYRGYRDAYRAAGGQGLIAANRPIYVGADDASAFREAEPALRLLWRRFQKEGKIMWNAKEPSEVRDLCGHPINFVVGGPQSVAEQLLKLHREAPFEVANLEVSWDGLATELIDACVHRIAEEVRPLLSQTL
jgi:alkanesulfonate monooxygenase SsuD/methylene tetrahydromethanopterin reductase-like flavin-dependent oxidoreductase (luciferase family)